MNLAQINEFRIAHNLQPLTAKDSRAQKRAQDANKAARGQACRDLKAKRSKGGK